MKKIIGISVLLLAALAFLISTCEAPSAPSVAEEPRSQATSSTSADSSVADRRVQPAVPDSTAREARPDTVAQAATTVAAKVTSEQDTTHSAVATRWSPTLRPVPVLPPGAREVVLAIPARDLEGGTGRTLWALPAPETVDSLRTALHLPLDGTVVATANRAGHPSSTINTPTAFGPGWKQVYAGVAYQDRIRYDDWRDGVATVGFGLGDPLRYAGLDVTLNVLDTYTNFAQDRSLSLKLHRRLPWQSAVALGYENLWHTPGTDGGSSRYVVVSKVVLLRDRPASALGSVVLNLGLGDDRFLSEERFVRGETGVNAFGSLAVRVAPPVSAIANWTGQDLALGLSIAPIRSWPIVITPALVDVTGSAGDGARFSVSAGIGYNFRR